MKDLIVAPKYLWDGISDHVSEDRAVWIQDGIVQKIDKKDRLLQACPSIPVYENSDWLLMPAFVNAHDHGRGISPVGFGAPDRALEMWLQDLNKLPAIPHYIACYYDGIRLASSGVGTVLHSHNPNNFSKIGEEIVSAAKGYKDAGVRSILCPLYLDQNKRIYYNRNQFIDSLPEPLRSDFAAGIRDQIMSIDEYLELVEQIRDELKEEIEGGWTEIQLHPNGGQWCSDAALLRMKEHALSRQMYIHLHLLETQYQAEYARRTWGKSFIKHYQEIGFLGPWVSFAHAVWMDNEDLELIAASGAKLITNPSSNLRLRSGIFNMRRAGELDLLCGIGLDGCAFDDDQDYLREIRVAWLNNLHNGVDGDVNYLNVLKMATSKGAAVAAGKLSPGVIAQDHNADFVCISVDSIAKPYADSGLDPLALLVQRATRKSVEMTFVNGGMTWGREERFQQKESNAEEQICQIIHQLREADSGKRDNSVILSHVHDFYAR